MNRRAERIGAAAMLAALVLAYAGAIDAAFQFDDWNVIVNFTPVHTFSAWFEALPSIRPLLKLSYTLNHAIDTGPMGFRLVNDLLHVANVALVYLALERLGRWQIGAAIESAAQGRFAAAVGAGIFALHPVQTEAVTYISGRSTSLCAFFALLALVTWLMTQTDARARWPRIVSPLALMLALWCKEYAAVLPLVLALCAGLAPERPGWRAVWRATRVHWAIVLGMGALALATPRYQQLLAISLQTRDPMTAVFTQAHAIAYLAGQLLRPDRLNADPDLPVIVDPDFATLAICAALLGLTLAGLRHRRRPAAFAVLWFLVWLAPTNSLLPRLDVANDRQLYVALIAPAWICGLALAHWPIPRARGAVALALLLGLAWLTQQRNQVYANEVSFWQDVVEKSPRKARGHGNLGYAYAQECRLDAARMEFERALQLDPSDMRARVNLALLRSGDLPGLPPGCAGQALGAPAR